MKINYIKQCTKEIALEIKYDLLIGASGYEKRGSYFFSHYNPISESKICLGFKNNKEGSREINDLIFQRNHFNIIEVNNNSTNDIIKILNDELSQHSGKEELRILVDFSCMSTLMYASIFKYFNDVNQYKRVTIYFSYTQSVYSKPKNRSPLKHHSPITILNNIELTDKKIALIIGLGYDRDKALGLYEYFQNDLTDMYLFMTSDNIFSKDVLANNLELISKLSENNIIKYDISNISYLISTLDSLVTYLLNNNFRVVISPTGPKIFALASLIIGMYHKNVSIYRSSMGDTDDIVDKEADINKEIIITEVNFTND